MKEKFDEDHSCVYPIKGKIIFLDIDGVIATPKQIQNYVKTHNKPCPPGIPQIDKTCVVLLAKLVHEFDAKVVISSSWRKIDHDMHDLFKVFSYYGIPIVGGTPSMPSGFRGEEISTYMVRHAISINDIVVLDDSKEDLSPFDNDYYLVNTDPFMGLEENTYEKAREILGR